MDKKKIGWCIVLLGVVIAVAIILLKWRLQFIEQKKPGRGSDHIATAPLFLMGADIGMLRSRTAFSGVKV